MGYKRCLYNRWYFSPRVTGTRRSHCLNRFFSVCQIWVPFFGGHTNIIPYRHIYPNFGWLTSDICASGTPPMASPGVHTYMQINIICGKATRLSTINPFTNYLVIQHCVFHVYGSVLEGISNECTHVFNTVCVFHGENPCSHWYGI